MFTILLIYNSSTFALAQGVFRKNFRLDFTLGSWMKQLMEINFPKRSKPNSSTSSVTIFSNVIPCRGSIFQIIIEGIRSPPPLKGERGGWLGNSRKPPSLILPQGRKPESTSYYTSLRYLIRFGAASPKRLRLFSSYSEYDPSNQTTSESPSKAKICVQIRSRNQRS